MNSISSWLLESIRLSAHLVRARWAQLGGLFVVVTALGLQVEDAMQLASETSKDQRWDLQLVLGLSDLGEGILLLLLLSMAVSQIRRVNSPLFLAEPFATPYLGSFLAEYLRVLAQVLMYGLLLLIPGFVRYAQLIFVPLVTLFSTRYRDGHLDALRASETMAKGRLGRIFAALVITTLLGLVFEFLPQVLPSLHNYPVRILCALLSFATAVWAYSLIYLLFEPALEALPVEEM